MQEYRENPDFPRYARTPRRRRLDYQRREGGVGFQRHNRYSRHGALRRRPVERARLNGHRPGAAEPARYLEGKAAEQDRAARLNQGEIFLDEVRIPKDYVFVEPDMYILAADLILSTANGGMGALFTGVARAAFEEAMSYCKQRVQGGKTLCEHQLIQRKLFDMFIKVESARLVAGGAHVQRRRDAAALALRRGVEVFCHGSFEVASDAVQLFGGMGLSGVSSKLFTTPVALIEDGANDTLALAATQTLLDSFV
jgi:hypothetical protein